MLTNKYFILDFDVFISLWEGKELEANQNLIILDPIPCSLFPDSDKTKKFVLVSPNFTFLDSVSDQILHCFKMSLPGALAFLGSM